MPRKKNGQYERVDTHEVMRRMREQKEAGEEESEADRHAEEKSLMDAIKASVRPRDDVAAHLASLCEAVKENQWIANCCMVDWLDKDLWKLVREKGWDTELESLSDAEVADLSLGELSRELTTPSLSKFVRECSSLRLDAEKRLSLLGGRSRVPLIAMSTKKEHEVEVMSRVCSALAREAGAGCVVDIGSGKGYLTTAIAAEYGLTTVGIDSLEGNTSGAVKRHALVNRITTGGSGAGNSSGASGGDQRGDFVAVTGYVRMEGGSGDEFVGLLEEKSQGLVKHGDVILMAGLHTCGDLAPTMLRSFTEWGQVKAFCGVGCCYNLLTQECEDHKFDIFGATEEDVEKRGRNPGFPLSDEVKGCRIYLNRNCRNLAAHNHRPVEAGQNMSAEERSTCYRAALQKLWKSSLSQHAAPELQTGNISVGKIASKCPTLRDYIHKAMSKLKIGPHSLVPDEEIERLWAECESSLRRSRLFCALRQLIATCIESLILLDRLLYLQSSPDMETASLVPLFDPKISPRCYAVIGIRRK